MLKLRISFGTDSLYETKTMVKVGSEKHIKLGVKLRFMFNVIILGYGTQGCQSLIFSMNIFS